METVVSTVQDRWKVERKLSCVIVLLLSLLLGVPSCLGFNVWSEFTLNGMSVLDMFDFLTNSVMMPIGAFLTCILVAFFVKPKVVIEEVTQSGEFKQKTLFSVVIRYVAPVCILVILVSAVLSAFGVIAI